MVPSPMSTLQKGPCFFTRVPVTFDPLCMKTTSCPANKGFNFFSTFFFFFFFSSKKFLLKFISSNHTKIIAIMPAKKYASIWRVVFFFYVNISNGLPCVQSQKRNCPRLVSHSSRGETPRNRSRHCHRSQLPRERKRDCV
jgi:hypothetical protein